MESHNYNMDVCYGCGKDVSVANEAHHWQFLSCGSLQATLQTLTDVIQQQQGEIEVDLAQYKFG